MSDRLRHSLRLPLLPAGGGLVILLLSMVLLLGGQLWLSYRDQIRTAEISAHNLAAIFEARFEAALRRIDADLIILAGEIPASALHPAAVAHFAPEVSASLERRMLNRDEMSGYRVLDAQGELLYFSGHLNVHNLSLADRSYFQQLRDDPGAGLVISEVLTARALEKEVLILARGLRDAKGRFLGVVYGQIDLAYYRRQFESLDLGKHGLIALRRDNHALVLRFPDLPGEINKSLPERHPVVQRMASGARGMSLHYEAAPDFVPRILSIVRMRDFPFYFAVGFGRSEVLDVWHQQVVVVVASAVMLFLLVAALLARLWRAQTRQQRMLQDLAASEAQFRELTQLVPVGIAYFDCDGKCTYVNDRCAAIAGRDRLAMTGVTWSEFVHPDDFDVLPSRSISADVALSQAYARELRFIQPGGQVSYALAEVQAGVGPEERGQGYLAALTDITERKQTEAELLLAKQRAENADLSKTRFLAAASHDLRQPIQAINLFLDALRRTDLSAEQKTIADFLSRSGHALGELLYALLDLSKLDSGQIRPHPRPVELEAFFRAIDAEFSTLARQKNLRFKLFFPFERRVLMIDPGLLMSVIRNLVDNALKYTERGGVLVGARTRQGRTVIQIWDTGMGVDPQNGERIFDECYQVKDSFLDRSKGLGLGLSIARRMAQLLGCELAYRSRFGKGSVFEVMLPEAAEEHAAEGMPVVEETVGASTVTDVDESAVVGWVVAVIEDDAMVAKVVELSLDELGARVMVFDSAESALESEAILTADFYVSDFNLPGMDGLRLLQTIRDRRAAPIRAVLVTGEAFHRRETLEADSPWPVLFKPVEMAVLLGAMSEEADGMAGRHDTEKRA